jgi:hypothetical protein
MKAQKSDNRNHQAHQRAPAAALRPLPDVAPTADPTSVDHPRYRGKRMTTIRLAAYLLRPHGPHPTQTEDPLFLSIGRKDVTKKSP